MLSESIKKFVSIAPLMMPNIIGDEMPEIESYDKSAVLEYSLIEEHEIEEILERLEGDMDMYVLYHAVRERAAECRQHACALSDPNVDYIYKVNVVTNRNEKVDHITVSIYSDIDDIILESRNDLSLHERGGFSMISKMSEREFVNLLTVSNVK